MTVLTAEFQNELKETVQITYNGKGFYLFNETLNKTFEIDNKVRYYMRDIVQAHNEMQVLEDAIL